MTQLIDIWFLALEQVGTPNAKTQGYLLKVNLSSEEVATWTRFELYKLRSKLRRESMSNLPPEDPGYNTSPFDRLRIYQEGPSLLIREMGSSPFDFDIELPEGAIIKRPHAKSPSKKRPGKSSKSS